MVTNKLDIIKNIENEYDEKYKIYLCSNLDELKEHANNWNSLAITMPQRIPTLTYAWISAFLSHQLANGEQWFCILAYYKDKLIGVLPLTFKLQGNSFDDCKSLKTPVNLHTNAIDFIFKEGFELDFMKICIKIVDHLFKKWLSISFSRIPENSRLFSMRNKATRGAFKVSSFNSLGTCIDTSNDYLKFMERLSTKFKKNLRYQERRLKKLGLLETRFINTNSADFWELEQFLKIEASGWKANKGSAILQSPQMIAFYQTLCKNLETMHCLEWQFLELDKKVIAGHLSMIINGSIITFKIAYDEEFAKYSPGNILYQNVIEKAFNSDAIDELNCLSDHEWNKRWQMEYRKYYDISLVSLKPESIIKHIFPYQIKSIAKNIPGLKSFLESIRNKSNNK